MSEPNNVKRYDVTDIGRVWDCHIVMREDPDGDWVSYEDYENLKRVCDTYLWYIREP